MNTFKTFLKGSIAGLGITLLCTFMFIPMLNEIPEYLFFLGYIIYWPILLIDLISTINTGPFNTVLKFHESQGIIVTTALMTIGYGILFVSINKISDLLKKNIKTSDNSN